MNIFYRMVFLLIITLTTSCTMDCGSFFCRDLEEEELAVPILIETLNINSEQITRVVQDFTVGLKHDEELNLEQANVYFNEGIHTIQLEFTSQRILDICEARMLIVDVAEGLLCRLNQDPVLMPQYSTNPLLSEALEIYISCESYYCRYLDPFQIQWIGLEDNEVTYYAWDLYDDDKSCWHSRHEPYATARQIAFAQRDAEMGYQKNHEPDNSVFGGQRYFPTPKLSQKPVF